ncbi:RAD55 family ATPase [Sorangium sp. So ce128]|uniref:RAD55 family ATPase n=1 Tax=Sorangium sp. So ce128 TaxID=3133281 RepID=UPI003F5FAEF7
MSTTGDTPFSRLSTGVPGLDEVLGGGLPEYSFNLIAGEPGSGKTTLAHQIMFGSATTERRALYFTVLGEPALKMLRYLQQMSFFDAKKVGDPIRFVDLSQEVLQQDLGKVFDRIVQIVQETEPAIVVVDSFRAVVRARVLREAGEMELQSFLQRLALHLTSWQATTFLVGEYLEAEMQDNPIFTVADSIFWLSQSRERNSIVRKLQVMKLRGQASMPGLHTFRIDRDGLHIFPRVLKRMAESERAHPSHRVSSGVPGLDGPMGGGIPLGDTMLVAGPSGCGKTCLGTHFISGATPEEPGVLVVFEEHPKDYLARAGEMGFDLDGMVKSGALRIISLRPLDLSVDETLQELQQAVMEMHAKRLVIDSLTGFEVALAPAFREDFRESLYRMMGALTGAGVTMLMTVEVTESFHELRFSPHAVSFLTENIVILRYAEIDGALKKVLSIVKMRKSQHSAELHEFAITSKGMVIKAPLTQYQGILTGEPKLRAQRERAAYPGLTEEEDTLLQLLLEEKEATQEEIAAALGWRGAELGCALDRLVKLSYAIRVVEEGKTIYRPLARALGRE